MHKINARIQAHNISKSYKTDKKTSHSILKNFTTEFCSGILYGISGPSGCGKSTLLSLLAGCELADSGAIEYTEKNKKSISVSEARIEHKIAYVPQLITLLPELSVYENLQCKLLLNGICDKKIQKEIIMHWSDICSIESFLFHYPAMLSGGQRQRAAFTQACLIAPHFLLADEITAHLDSNHVVQCMKIFRSLISDYGSGVILVSHDCSILSQCDVIIDSTKF